MAPSEFESCEPGEVLLIHPHGLGGDKCIFRILNQTSVYLAHEPWLYFYVNPDGLADYLHVIEFIACPRKCCFNAIENELTRSIIEQDSQDLRLRATQYMKDKQISTIPDGIKHNQVSHARAAGISARGYAIAILYDGTR